MNFLKKRKQQSIESLKKLKISLASNMSSEMKDNDPEKMVKGIGFCEGLVVQPHRGDLFGLLAGPGVGKTTVTVQITGDVLRSNPDQFVVYFSLEMTKKEILNKCLIAFGHEEPELLERLIILDCYDDDDGSNKQMTVTDIKLQLKQVLQYVDSKVALTIIDHFHEVYNNGSIDYNPVAREFKDMAIECDTLVFLPSQTTKEKGQGDIPVPKSGCFGCSRFENLCSYILTIFQPLRRVQNECDLPALGWQFCKIRNKRGKKDSVKEEINYVLKYNSDNESLEKLNSDEVFTFQMYYEKVLELRESEEKKKAYAFDLSTTIKGENGKEIRITKIIDGSSE